MTTIVREAEPTLATEPLATPGQGVVVIVVAGGATAAAATTAFAAPIIALISGVVVALIASRTARRLQARQLAAEAQRQQRAIAAEHDRLRIELAHARELADISDARTLLDGASTELRRTARVLENYAADPRQKHAVMAALDEEDDTLDDLAGRLRVRLDATAPVTVALADTHTRVREIRRCLGLQSMDPASAAAALERAVLGFGVAVENFNDAAVDLIGFRPRADQGSADDDHGDSSDPRPADAGRAARFQRRSGVRPRAITRANGDVQHLVRPRPG